MPKIIGYAAKHSFSDLKPLEIERKNPDTNDVKIDILFCGVCHSDIHQAKNEWKNTIYPCMPGHEIVGRVSEIGSAVKKFKLGDIVGVGCMIDSCQLCENCKGGNEQYCKDGALLTYNGNMRKPAKDNLTFGGYSQSIVVREKFVLKMPENLDPAASAPLLCAGVTTFSPMKHWQVGKGTKVGIVGMGGLGHVAIKIALALGAEVTLITTNKDKIQDAKSLGVNHIIVSTDEKMMKENSSTLDFILSTIPQPHDANPYVNLLNTNGVLTIVGCLVPLKSPLDMSKMIMDRRSIGSSLIGSIAETEEVLAFCSQHNIVATIKLISINEINDAFEKVNKGEVDFRYVINMNTLVND